MTIEDLKLAGKKYVDAHKKYVAYADTYINENPVQAMGPEQWDKLMKLSNEAKKASDEYDEAWKTWFEERNK